MVIVSSNKALVVYPMSVEQKLHPVIIEFKALIENDPVVRMDMTSMIDQIPAKYK